MVMVNINLLPWREELKEQQSREFRMILLLALFAAAALMVLIHVAIQRQIVFQEEDNLYLKKEIAILEQKLEEIKLLEKQKKQLLAKMQVIQELQASRPGVVRLFDGIVRLIPPGLYLTNLSRVGNKIQIDGKAESNTRVSTLMRNIEASQLLTDPMLSVIQADDQKNANPDRAKQAMPSGDRTIDFNLQAKEETAVKLVGSEPGKPGAAAATTDSSNKQTIPAGNK